MSRPFADNLSGTALLVALCPLLAVSDTVVTALGLGLAIIVLVPLVSAAMLAVRSSLQGTSNDEIALAASMLLAAGIVACLELLMRAWMHELHRSLGMFLPLAVTNLAIVEHLQAREAPADDSLRRGLKLALVIALVLLVLGFARELVGRGSLLHDAGSLLGEWARGLEMNVFSVDMGFLLAMLPPGAFISLGLCIAAYNWMRARRAEPTTAA